MAKDKKARRNNRLTVMALGNLMAAIVDAMRESDLPNEVTHDFLDRLEQLNIMTLCGEPAVVLAEIIDVMRSVVPGND